MVGEAESTGKRKDAHIWYLIAGAVILLLGMVFGGIESTKIRSGAIELALHAFLNAVSGLLILIAAILGFRYLRQRRGFFRLVSVGFLGLAVNGIIGYFVASQAPDPPISGVHFLTGALTLGVLSAAATLAVLSRDHKIGKETAQTSFARHTLRAVVLVGLALTSSIYLSRGGFTLPGLLGGLQPEGWIGFVHEISVAAIGIYLLFYHRLAWRSQRSSRLVLTFANMLVVLFLAQGFVGALKIVPAAPQYLEVLHKFTGAGLAVVAGILVIAVRHQSSRGEDAPRLDPGSFRQRIKDFLVLTKPIVVLLLLATTFGGMVMGARGLPRWDVILVTLFSGALAAGGSGAVNQYLDRDLDGVMARTSKRPIPAGRLTSAEGLAFGVTAIVISFYLLAGFVNMLAALVTLAGMVYYVFLYSILLKKRTVQNIVIGGGAGAMPPLVGWAAATGSLDLTAGFLFLIIFLWTPPHFWALALTRKNEYRDAGIPMMPVERGDEVTRKMIFQYTVVLVFASILMWVLGLAGWLFLTAAVLLGGYLLWLAWKVWRDGRKRVYYQMYRHSNYYLLLIFFILALDSILV